MSQIAGLLGYLDLAIERRAEQLHACLGYLEVIGTLSPLSSSQDEHVHGLYAYAETVPPRRSLVMGGISGYVEFSPPRSSLLLAGINGYVEWIGTPSPLPSLANVHVHGTTAYVEWAGEWVEPPPPPDGPTIIVFWFWM